MNVFVALFQMILLAALYIYEIKRKGMDIFSPFSITLIMFLLIFPFKALVLALVGDCDPSLLMLAQGYMILGISCMLAAYYMPFGKKIASGIRAIPSDWVSLNRVLIGAISSIGGIALYFAILRMTGIGDPISALQNTWVFRRMAYTQGMAYISMLMQYLLVMPLVAWWISILMSRRKERLNRLFFWLYTIFVAAIFFTFAVRGLIVGLIFSMLVCSNYLKRPVSLRTLAVVFVAILLFIGFAGMYRASAGSGSSFFEVAENVRSLPLSDYAGVLVDRLDALPHFMEILDDFPSGGADFNYGSTFLGFILQPVPRSIMPDKPYLSGDVFTQAFHPGDVDWISYDPSLYGELFMSFHWGGIVLGFLLLGLICRIFQEYIALNSRSAGTIAFYSLVFGFPSGILATGFASGLTISFFFTLVFVLAYCSLLSHRLKVGA